MVIIPIILEINYLGVYVRFWCNGNVCTALNSWVDSLRGAQFALRGKALCLQPAWQSWWGLPLSALASLFHIHYTDVSQILNYQVNIWGRGQL